MPLKATDPASEYEEIDRWEGGVGWLAHPGEAMQRASHALASGDDVWLVDPLDAPGIDELLGEFGSVAGVVVTLDRHTRDAANLAARHDVRVYMPKWVAKGADVPGPITIFDETVPDTRYRALKVVDRPGWHEAALHDPHADTLYVSEALGANEFTTVAGERLGVHPVLRLFPPTSLRDLEPERVLVGHGRGVSSEWIEGDGVETDAAAALRDAVDGSRGRFPALLGKTVRSALDRW